MSSRYSSASIPSSLLRRRPMVQVLSGEIRPRSALQEATRDRHGSVERLWDTSVFLVGELASVPIRIPGLGFNPFENVLSAVMSRPVRPLVQVVRDDPGFHRAVGKASLFPSACGERVRALDGT